MIFSIYRIQNKNNNKCYIGYTRDIDRRWKQHKSMPDPNRTLYKAFAKYGIDNFNFDIIYQSYNEKHTKSMEKYFVSEYNSYGSGYNMTEGGDDNNTPKLRKQNSKRMKNNNPMKPGITNSGSFKKGFSIKNTKEQNKKIAKALTGKGNGNYGNPEASSHLNSRKATCPHCGMITSLGNAKRWHFDNCKKK
jgi:group I intron endonuclease